MPGCDAKSQPGFSISAVYFLRFDEGLYAESFRLSISFDISGSEKISFSI